MDAYEAITTKLDVRELASRHVPGEIKRKILEAARLTGSSMNTQHWRFLVIQDRPSLKTLAKDSTSGAWIEGADFAIVILTDPKVSGYMIDTGRVLQAMELAGVESRCGVRRLYGGQGRRPSQGLWISGGGQADCGPRFWISKTEDTRQEEEKTDRGPGVLGALRETVEFGRKLGLRGGYDVQRHRVTDQGHPADGCASPMGEGSLSLHLPPPLVTS